MQNKRVLDGGRVPAPAKLSIVSSSGHDLFFELRASPVRVGRAFDNDLVVTAAVRGWDTVSRHHARLCYDDRRGRWAVRDEGSSNGTYVNGARTRHTVPRDGARIAFGGMEAVFRQGAYVHNRPNGNSGTGAGAGPRIRLASHRADR
jgi:pSer/pThr/pTyr-binding forkhead associated (FHA) protein